MRRLLPALLIAAAACSEPLVPPDFVEPDAVAEVSGLVLKASGAPVVAGSVNIRCANDQFGGAAPINAEGKYRALLGASAEVLGGPSGSVLCVFTAPGGISAERTISFAPPATPPGMQVVDLRGG